MARRGRLQCIRSCPSTRPPNNVNTGHILLLHGRTTADEDTLADVILIAQVVYYRKYPYRRRRRPSHPPGPSHLSPATPLLDPNKPPKRLPPMSTAKAG